MRNTLRCMTVLLALTMGVASAGLLGDNVNSTDFSGSRSTPLAEGVFGATDTDWEPVSDGGHGFKVAWDISFDSSAGLYSYEYRFRNELGQAGDPFERELSHWITQVSTSVTADNWQSQVTDIGSNWEADFNTAWGLQGQSNPGLDALYGVKFDYAGPADDPEQFVTTFNSPRRPVWGHFYGKSGNGAYAMNAGLYYEQEGLSYDPFDSVNFVPTVDTKGHSIPEPATMALGMLGLAGCALTFWRRQW